MRSLTAFSILALSLVVGCNEKDPDSNSSSSASAKSGAGATVSVKRLDFPGTEEGAQALVAELVKPGADVASLSASLRPDPKDYAAVFEGDAASKVEKSHSKMWDDGKAVFKPKEGQTATLVSSQTTDKMKSGDTGNCPGGYKDAAAQMKAGLTVYCFKFVQPGESRGMAFDGLVHVNGHWAIFPKPFAALK